MWGHKRGKRVGALCFKFDKELLQCLLSGILPREKKPRKKWVLLGKQKCKVENSGYLIRELRIDLVVQMLQGETKKKG